MMTSTENNVLINTFLTTHAAHNIIMITIIIIITIKIIIIIVIINIIIIIVCK